MRNNFTIKLKQILEFWWFPFVVPVAFVTVIMIRILSPVVIVRFIEFKTWSMGCLAQYPELYRCHRILDDQKNILTYCLLIQEKLLTINCLKCGLESFLKPT